MSYISNEEAKTTIETIVKFYQNQDTKIQYWCNSRNDWIDTNPPDFHAASRKYRLKPIRDWDSLIGCKVRRRTTSELLLVVEVKKDYLYIGCSSSVPFKEFDKHYEVIDENH